MTFTFILLAFSTCAVWAKDLKISIFSIPLWIVFLITALVSSLINHYVEWSGILWIASFGLLSYLANHTAHYRLMHAFHLTIIGLMALFMAMEKLPGFHNPDIVTNLRFNSDGLPFTHRLRIDGISVGIILLAIFCNPVRIWKDWLYILRKSAPIILMSFIVILGCGFLLNYVAVNVKFIPYTLVFLVANLLFTCVMEESFFRGFLQENITKLLSGWRYGAPLDIGIAALSFGLAHIKGGVPYMGLATLAGLCYGFAQYRVRHIEAAILTHFSVNAIHFIALTYPNF